MFKKTLLIIFLIFLQMSVSMSANNAIRPIPPDLKDFSAEKIIKKGGFPLRYFGLDNNNRRPANPLSHPIGANGIRAVGNSSGRPPTPLPFTIKQATLPKNWGEVRIWNNPKASKRGVGASGYCLIVAAGVVQCYDHVPSFDEMGRQKQSLNDRYR